MVCTNAWKVFIVDDEENLCSLLSDTLENEGFKVAFAKDAEKGYRQILTFKPDVALLDVEVPKMGGFELCALLRKNYTTKNIPIIMLTVRASEIDKVAGLNAGADDYMIKPFSNRELVARIKSVLRRVKRKEINSKIKIESFCLDLDSRSAFVNKKRVELRPKEFDLLYLFLCNPNEVLRKEFIIQNIFESVSDVNVRTLDAHIKNLRHQLGNYGEHIETVFKLGYKFIAKKEIGKAKC
ncbi:MAG: response regulator transcription factor [Elusimicrobiota bacterium]|jgi:DNA-binding response OmpR family regulator|nr:response regulator transcription factor [Elusimicrobiota bacterium]